MNAVKAFFASFWPKFWHSFGSGLLLSVIASPDVAGLVSSPLLSLATLKHAVAVGALTYTWGYLVKNAPTWFGSSVPPAGSARLGVLLALLALAPAVLACPTPSAAGATVTVMAAGDSAKISFHWPAVNKATGYVYTVTAVASNGSWTGLPSAVSTASTSGSAVGISSTADTAVFQVCASSTGASGTSAIGCSTSAATAGNTWHRKLQPPAPVVDSIALRPGSVNLQLASSRIMCGFQGFHDGQIAERTPDLASCDSLYRKFGSAHRRPTAAEQAYADTATWQWATNNPAAVGLVPRGFGSSAVLVQGNGLTWAGPRIPVERYAALEDPVARIDSTYVNSDGTAGAAITCLRTGTQRFTASAGGRAAEFEVACNAGPGTRIAASVIADPSKGS